MEYEEEEEDEGEEDDDEFHETIMKHLTDWDEEMEEMEAVLAVLLAKGVCL